MPTPPAPTLGYNEVSNNNTLQINGNNFGLSVSGSTAYLTDLDGRIFPCTFTSFSNTQMIMTFGTGYKRLGNTWDFTISINNAEQFYTFNLNHYRLVFIKIFRTWLENWIATWATSPAPQVYANGWPEDSGNCIGVFENGGIEPVDGLPECSEIMLDIVCKHSSYEFGREWAMMINNHLSRKGNYVLDDGYKIIYSNAIKMPFSAAKDENGNNIIVANYRLQLQN